MVLRTLRTPCKNYGGETLKWTLMKSYCIPGYCQVAPKIETLGLGEP